MGRRRVIAAASLTTALLLGSGTPARAQGDGQDEPQLEAADLGVSMARIKKQLERLPDDDEARALLRYDFYVEVYGRAPRVELDRDFDVHTGPVPYGAPTHAEMMAVMRPDRITPPAANIGAVIGWALRRLRP